MDLLKQVRFVKHGTVCISNGETVVYVDPYNLEHVHENADLIIITHSHSDHFSPEDIQKIAKPDTCFATTADVANKLRKLLHIPDEYITVVSCETPNICYEFGVSITPVEAENKNHPLGFGFGVVVEMGNIRYYLSGDTDRLAQDTDCDVLFVACDGIYNMPDFEQLVPDQIAKMDQPPKMIVPYHYAEFPGTEDNGKRLAKVLAAAGYDTKVLIK